MKFKKKKKTRNMALLQAPTSPSEAGVNHCADEDSSRRFGQGWASGPDSGSSQVQRLPGLSFEWELDTETLHETS